MFNEETIIEGLKDYLEDFTGAINQGLAIRKTAYAEHLTVHRASTRAGLVNDHIVDHARRLLEPKGIAVRRVKNRILFYFPNAIVTFKKLGRNKVASNYPTQLAKQFTAQTELPGLFPEYPRLIVGYIPTDDWTGVRGMYVVMPRDIKSNAWAYSLSQEEVIQPQFPQLESPENETRSRKPRVRAKSGVSTIPNTSSRKAATG